MKRIAFLMMMLAGFAVQAQKQAKPNLNKALGFLKDGKLAEAKEMIDAATTYEKWDPLESTCRHASLSIL